MSQTKNSNTFRQEIILGQQLLPQKGTFKSCRGYYGKKYPGHKNVMQNRGSKQVSMRFQKICVENRMIFFDQFALGGNFLDKENGETQFLFTRG